MLMTSQIAQSCYWLIGMLLMTSQAAQRSDWLYEALKCFENATIYRNTKTPGNCYLDDAETVNIIYFIYFRVYVYFVTNLCRNKKNHPIKK